MIFIYALFGTPLGWVMWLITRVITNYGLALLVFTIIIRACLFPLSLKQQKSTVKMSLIQPKLKEIQTKYANNRQKMSEEMDKLYKEEGYNPMSGCLPLLIQMPILFGLIDVIYNPLKHILHMSADAIARAQEILVAITGVEIKQGGLNLSQLQIIREVKANAEAFSALGADVIQQIQALDFNFLGMDLTVTPSVNMLTGIFSGGFNPVAIIPILSGLSAFIMVRVSMKNNAASQPEAARGSMGAMMMVTPVMSLVIAFSVPAGVGLYWTYSNLVALVQSIIMNRIYNPKEIAEKVKQEEQERKEKERQERIEAKKRSKEEGNTGAKGLSKKEADRRKLAEARKRDAERYGEEYIEVTDEDLK